MNKKFVRLKAIIKKEFLTIFKDPKNRALIIVPPILQLFVFAHAITLEITNIDISVLDYSSSPMSRELVSRFNFSPWFRKIYLRKNIKDLKDDIDLKKSQIGIIIQNDFEKNIYSKKNSQVFVIVDGRQTNSASLASSYASLIIDEFSRNLERKALDEQSQINVITRNWFNPNNEYRWFLTVSLIVMLSLVLALLLSSLSIAREREMGTFSQLTVSPLSPDEIIIGKVVPPLVVAFVSSVVITLIIAFVFKVPFLGSCWLYVVSNFVALYSIIGIGIFISSLSYTQQQAVLGVFIFQTPAVLLSGFVSPVEDMNMFFRFLSSINPIRYYMLVIKGIYFKNMDFLTVLQNIGVLFVIGTICLIIARATFKFQLEKA